MVQWETLLTAAAERVFEVSSSLYSSDRGSFPLGTGAGGDTTMLVDQEAENACMELFRGLKDTTIITEERGTIGSPGSTWTIVIDPIDGSSNFARRLPFFCTSIAVANGAGLRSVKYGIVKNLITGEKYYAERGAGASKDGKTIQSSSSRELANSVLTVDMCRSPLLDVRRVARLISSIRRQVHLGANALEMCLVGEGKLDGFVDIRGRMRITDFAASYLVAEEAGAHITDLLGRPLNPRLGISERFRVVAAGNSGLSRKIRAMLSGSS